MHNHVFVLSINSSINERLISKAANNHYKQKATKLFD